MTGYSAQGIVVVKRRSKDAKTILSTSVMYAISDSGVKQPTDGWSSSVLATTPSQPWLWTRTTITYSEGEPSVVYTVSRQGTDGTNGTSFTPKGVALGHYSGVKALIASVSKFEVGDTYILDMCSDGGSVNQSIPNPCVVVYMNAPDYDWYATQAEEGDGYNVNGTLYVNSDAEWVDFGDIQGPAGDAGEDALVAEVNPSPIVLQSDDKGQVAGWKEFYISVLLGAKNVTSACSFSVIPDDGYSSNFTIGGSVVQISSSLAQNGKKCRFSSAAIATDPVSVDNNGTTQTYNVARTAGYFTIKCIYGDRVCYARVQFSVSISAFFQSYIRNDYYMKSQYQKLESKQGTLESTTSTLIQTADELTAQIEVVQGDVNKKAGLDIAVTHDENGVIDTNVTLNADRININAQHSIDIVSDGCFTVNSTNFKLDGSGNMKAHDAELNAATINGTIRSIYQTAESGSDLSKADNIFLTSSSWFNYFSLKWDKTQIGRTIRIANYTEDSAMFNAQESKKFITINGMQVDQIGVAPMRCCVLHGLGYGDNFIAWCVEQSYTYKAVLPQYGMKYLSKGFVSVTGTTPVIEYQKTCNGSVSVSRIGQGYYRLSLPTEWSSAYRSGGSVLIYRIGVMLQGCGYSNDDGNKSAPIKATLKNIGWKDSAKSQIYVDVWTSDDETVNDGSFQFLIYNMDSSLDN